MTVRHSSWAERVYGPSLKESCCKACTKNVFKETPCDTEVGGSIYIHTYCTLAQAHQLHNKRRKVHGCGCATHGTRDHLRMAGKWVLSHIREHLGPADQ
jgi:hypothetical protein